MRHHGAGLRRLLKNRPRAAAIRDDFRSAELSARELAILEYATKLTNSPKDMSEGDVVRLRNVGLSDAEILDVCQVTSYYNYVNRLADGLGVELEGYWTRIPED